MSPPPPDIPQLLQDWSAGDREARIRLWPLLMTEVKRITRRHLDREAAPQTLNPTAMIDELYRKLVDRSRADPKTRALFFGFVSRIARQVLVDYARSHRAAARGPAAIQVGLEAGRRMVGPREVEVVALDDALGRIAKLKPRQASAVEMRYFSGLTNDGIAEVLHVSPTTVSRDLRQARPMLLKEAEGSASYGPPGPPASPPEPPADDAPMAPAPAPATRHVNTWFEGEEPVLPLAVGQRYPFHVQIGPRRAAGGPTPAPFVEPDWGTRQEVWLLLTLYSEDFAIEGRHHSFSMPRSGESPVLTSHLSPRHEGACRLEIVISLARELEVLQELQLEVEAVGAEVAAGAHA